MEIRTATLADRPTFLRLWREYLLDRHKAGYSIEPCDENLLTFLGLFEGYIAGGLFGFTLLAIENDEVVGLGMGGEWPPGGLTFRTSDGKVITTWGVYVIPEHRRKGIARELQDAAAIKAREMGFDTMLSNILATDPVANANATNWGLNVVEYLVSFPLAETKHGKQRSTQ